MYCEKLSKQELITELHKLKCKNKELETEKLQIRDMVQTLITKISHEFKTPLNSIIGFTELLKYNIKTPKERDYIDTISSSSQYMFSLIKDILDITRAKYKPLELSYRIFNAREVIEEIITCFRNDSLYYTLININICADYTRFKQLVYNLISNALKYNRAGYPSEIITYTEKKEFCFEITDYGEGIKEDDYEKIFDFFTPAANAHNLSSGIGLSLCKTITEAHRGSISVASGIGMGSTFTFKIPIGI